MKSAESDAAPGAVEPFARLERALAGRLTAGVRWRLSRWCRSTVHDHLPCTGLRAAVGRRRGFCELQA